MKIDKIGSWSEIKIEPVRLRELIMEVLKTYGASSISDINERIGPEISEHQIRKQLKYLLAEARIRQQGDRRWRRYLI